MDVVAARRLRKDLNPSARIAEAEAHDVRPACLEDPTREPAMYRKVLAPMGIGAPLVSSGADWVLIEQVEGVELWQVGDPEVWVQVAAWLAGLHKTLRGADFDDVPLAEYGPGLFEAELERAGSVPSTIRAASSVAQRILAEEPAGVLHGDMYPSNLLVDPGPPLRVIPVDWELAGRGPAVLDLAALASGGWSDDIQPRMAAAYFGRDGDTKPEEWQPRLDAAVLQISLRWLGAPPAWKPPAAHRHDWAGQAERAAVRLLAGAHG
jgi:hypothetical protein